MATKILAFNTQTGTVEEVSIAPDQGAPDATASYRTVTSDTSMLVTDRDVAMMASVARTLTLLSPDQFVLGADYHFSKIGAGNMTVNGTIYDSGGEVTSLTVLDGESLVLRRYQKTDNSAGLRIVTQG